MTLAEQLELVSAFLTKNPAAGQMVPRANSDLVGPYEVRTHSDGHEITIDEPSTIGGAGLGPSPVELALVSLGSCQAITYRLWATRLGIHFDHIRVVVEGDYDARGLLGVEGHGRPGLTAVRVAVSIEGPEPDRYNDLRTAVNEHCPVLDLFTDGVTVTTALTRPDSVEPQPA